MPGLLCSFYDIEHVVFEYMTVFVWFITSFESLNHYSVTKSQVPVSYPVDILSEYGYSLTVLCFCKLNLLFAISSLTKVILIKVYRACLTVFPVSSPSADN